MTEEVTKIWGSEVEHFSDGTIVRFAIFGYIGEEAASDFIRLMWESDATDPTARWDVTINTEGGDMEAGTAIFSELRAHSYRGGGHHHVTVKVRGQAASCGSLILQAGDHRVAGTMDYLMLHEPLMSFTDATLRRVKDELDQAEMWTERFLDVLMERATKKRSLYRKAITDRDWWIGSGEALDFGLIDEVA